MPKRSSPEEPKILVNKDQYTEDYINSPYGNSYEVNWKIPADNGEPIDHYSVTFCEVSTAFYDFVQKSTLETVTYLVTPRLPVFLGFFFFFNRRPFEEQTVFQRIPFPPHVEIP